MYKKIIYIQVLKIIICHLFKGKKTICLTKRMVDFIFFATELNHAFLHMFDDQSSMILKRLKCIKNFKTDQKKSGHYNPKEFSYDKCVVVGEKKNDYKMR